MINSVKTCMLAAASLALIGTAAAQTVSYQTISGAPSLKTAGYMTPEQLRAAYSQSTTTTVGGTASTVAPTIVSGGTYASGGTYTTTSVANSVGYQNLPSLKTASYMTPEQLRAAYTTVNTSPVTVATPSIELPVVSPSPEVIAPITAPIAPEPTGGMFDGMRFFVNVDGGVAYDSPYGAFSDIRMLTVSGGSSSVTEIGGEKYDGGVMDLGYFGAARVGAMLSSGLYGGLEFTGRTMAAENAITIDLGSNNTRTDTFKGSVTTIAGFATVGYQHQAWAVKPFGEVSVGYASNNASSDFTTVLSTSGTPTSTTTGNFEAGTTNGLAYGASLGVAYAISSNLEIRGGYRYRNYGVARTGFDADDDNRVEYGSMDSHEGFVGVGYYF